VTLEQRGCLLATRIAAVANGDPERGVDEDHRSATGP
jgi:hypothetical protein